MKQGKTINGIIMLNNNTIVEKTEGKTTAFTFLTEDAAKAYFNKRRIVKKGKPRLHRREVAVVYYSQTIICL